MVSTLVIMLVIIAAAVGWRARVVRRRRADQAMVVTTWPDVELNQPYGGWNADAYDAGTGRDRTAPLIYGASILQAANPRSRQPRQR